MNTVLLIQQVLSRFDSFKYVRYLFGLEVLRKGVPRLLALPEGISWPVRRTSSCRRAGTPQRCPRVSPPQRSRRRSPPIRPACRRTRRTPRRKKSPIPGLGPRWRWTLPSTPGEWSTLETDLTSAVASVLICLLNRQKLRKMQLKPTYLLTSDWTNLPRSNICSCPYCIVWGVNLNRIPNSPRLHSLIIILMIINYLQ